MSLARLEEGRVEVVLGAITCTSSGAGSSLFWKGMDSDLLFFLRGGWTEGVSMRRFLHRLHTETNDKIVLISNYTQTLDIFEKMLRAKK